jgi:hypothetical protein
MGAELMAWLMVGLYVATIFITLPLTPLLWSALLSYAQISFSLAASFVLLPSLAGCAFFIFRQNRQGYKTETEKVEVGNDLWPNSLSQLSLLCRVAGLVLLAALSLLTIVFFAKTPAETLHLPEYGGLSYLTLRAAKPHTYRAYLLCLLFVLLVGSIDEAIQFILPNRVFQLKDILLNGLSGTIGLATTILLHSTLSLSPTGREDQISLPIL